MQLPSLGKLYGMGECSGGSCMIWGKSILSVGMAITVMDFFDAKNIENKNLICDTINCQMRYNTDQLEEFV